MVLRFATGKERRREGVAVFDSYLDLFFTKAALLPSAGCPRLSAFTLSRTMIEGAPLFPEKLVLVL
jgi:hypothetical protein